MLGNGAGMRDKYDVIIIGSGIGGLICGSILAKQNVKVLILEKEAQVGGYCVSFKRNGIRFDAGAHIIGSCGDKGILTRILKSIGVEYRFQVIIPTDRFFFPDNTIDVPRDIDTYIGSLKKTFPKESVSLDKFFNKLLSISRNARLNYEKYKDMSYEEFLGIYFDNKILKATLSAQVGFLGIMPKDVSVVSMCAMMSSYMNDGAYYPNGGASAFANAIATAFIKQNGEIKLMHEVVHVTKTGQRNWLICTSDKKNKKLNFCCDTLVSDMDLTIFFQKLLDEHSVKNVTDILKHIDSSKETPSICAIYIAANIKTEYLSSKVGWHYKSYNINKDLDKCIFISSPSLYDSSASSDGSHVIEAMKLCPYLCTNPKSYYKYKQGLNSIMLDEVISIIPKIKNNIIVQESATPNTMYRYTFNKRGSVYGWASTPQQYKRNEIISKLCEPNLFLVGHWTNPGGGIVAVALSGYNAARNIIRNFSLAREAVLN